MSISAVSGSTKNNTTAGTSLVFSAASFTVGNLIVVAVSLLNTGVSVSSISDGSNTYTLQSAVNNGSSVRSEVWTAPVTVGGSLTITVNLSGSSLASACYEQYSGVTAIGNIGAGLTSGSYNAVGSVTTQDSGSYAVSSVAFANSSGDTASASAGTVRQSVIPALTTAASLLMDVTSTVPSLLSNVAILSSVRNWAAATIELRSGNAAVTVADSNLVAAFSIPAPFKVNPSFTTSVAPVPVGSVLGSGVIGTAYSETISVVGGTPSYTFAIGSGSLPAGLSLNSSTGVISGTPTTAGTYTFTVSVTDSMAAVGSQSFSIVVTAATSGGGGNYGFVG